MSGSRRQRNDNDYEARQSSELETYLQGLGSGSGRYDRMTDSKIELIHSNCSSQPATRRLFQKHAMALATQLSSYLLNCPSDDTSRSYVTHILTYVAKILIDEESSQLQGYLGVLANNVDMPGDLCKISILNAITKISKYLWKKRLLSMGSEVLLPKLFEILESTDNPVVLKPLIEGFLYYANDSSIFKGYFRDVSDILIGWHIDGSAGQELASFMASSLTTMAPYFSVDSDFSVSLIKQFQEDIASFTASILNGQSGVVDKLCSILLVMTNIANAIQNQVDIQVDAEEVMQNLLTVQRFLKDSCSLLSFLTEANVMCSSMTVLMSRSADICSFLTLQLNDAPQFQIHTRYLEALLNLTSLVISSTTNGQVHMTIMEAMFSPTGALYKLRSNKSVQIQESFVRVSRDIMALKDVPLVQAGFQYLASDLRSPNVKVALAAVGALQGMSETKNSLISLLAVRPSLFELLHSLVGDPVVEERVQPEILRLLRVHSITHTHFVVNSDLIEPSTSATANHFNMILQLFTKHLPDGGYIGILVLDWLDELIFNPTVTAYGEQLASAPVMTALVAAVVDVILKQWKNPYSERALNILTGLLKLEGWSFGEPTLSEVRKLAKLGSADKQILAVLDITGEDSDDLVERYDWQAGDPIAFKKFMLYVSGQSDKLSDTLLSRLYMKCEGDGSSSVPCSSVLWAWLAWQSAQHLVHGKLKSYLGKPQDSLGFIESVLKSSLDEHRGCVMLKFMDALERCMYQAYECTVTISNNYEKQCRAFFRANRNTCQEWLQRVRPFVAKLSITRCQHPLAVWQLESFFDNKLTLNSDQISFFASLYTKAVIELKAPNRLLGFAHFLSTNFTLSESLSQWLKASSQHAGQKLETALRSYEKLKLKDNPILTEMVKDQVESCRRSLKICDDITQWDELKLKNFVSRQRKKSNFNLAFEALRRFESTIDETLVLTEMTAEARGAYRFSSGLCNRQYSKLVRALDGPSAAVAVLSEGQAGDAESLVGLARVLTAGGVQNLSMGITSEGHHQWRVGLLLSQACQQKPDYAKAYFKFADWSYYCGKRDIDSGDTQIAAVEQKLISSVLTPLGVAHLSTPMCSVIGRIEYCDSGNCGCTSKKQKILALLEAESVPEPGLSQACDHLLSVELAVQSRVFRHYHSALDAYFHFLRLSPAGNDAAQAEATLRLLRLIVKHAHSLQDTLEGHMATNIVTEPWHAIIPQLFARLNHPEEYVRRTLVRLIARIGESGALRLVAYPAIVGEQAAHQEDRLANIRRLQQDPSQELSQSMAESSDEENDALEVEEMDDASKRCYAEICASLRRDNGAQMSEIELFVREMERVSVLWEEKCLAALTQHYPQLNQPGGTQMCTDLLKDLIQMTLLSPAETPHEEWFQKNFSGPLNKTLDTFQNCKDPEILKKAYKALCATVNVKIQEDVRSQLAMSTISPRLAGLRNTLLPVPGQNRATVASVASTVTLLPTKSKPKKFALIGDDGVRYTFLFKGLEDLHLDERIMQFLSISNRILSKRFGQNSYLARSYAVTPMGRRSGLIQWIDRSVPLFALYKRHQIAKQGYATRPTEMFYSKLIPKLNKANIPTDKRREWPKELLMQVVEELTKETPGDLLLREVWAACATPGQLWARQNALVHSVAVTSIVGYIIGLGDRHLDNILVDIHSGHIIHIDYNVCFERGTQLRVAERVPFRLTPILSRALGLNGLNGVFQVAAENILRTLRANRETLLTLLEAFVYDPLVDWTVGGPTSVTKAASITAECAVTQLVALCEEDGFQQNLMKVERELRVIWNQLTANVVEWRDNAIALADKTALITALQECPTVFQDLASLRLQFSELCKAVQDTTAMLASYCEQEHCQNPLFRLMAGYFSQTTSLWAQWLMHVCTQVDGPSIQQTLTRFQAKTVVSQQQLTSDLSYLAQKLSVCDVEHDDGLGGALSASVLHPRVLYTLTESPAAQRLIGMLDNFKIDVLPRLLAFSDFDVVNSPLVPVVGEGMELLSSMVATAEYEVIADRLEAEYEAVIAAAASQRQQTTFSVATPVSGVDSTSTTAASSVTGTALQPLLLVMDSLFGELRFIDKLQLIHGLFTAVQSAVTGGVSRLEAACGVIESLMIAPLLLTEASPEMSATGEERATVTARIPIERVVVDHQIITALMGLVQSVSEEPIFELPTIESVLDNIGNGSEADLCIRADLQDAVGRTRAAVLEVTNAGMAMLSNPSYARVAAKPGVASELAAVGIEVTNLKDALLDSISQQVQVLQAQVQRYWHPIGMALVDADVKLQELVDLTASVRHAEPTEFLLKNANWPQLSFNPVQVCFDTVGQFNNTCQFALRSFAGGQPGQIDLPMLHEASSQIGEIFHAVQQLVERLLAYKVVEIESKREEQRNRQGMLIWRRVRAKLEGRDTHDKSHLTVGQQLEKVIHEATSMENLALMYEGWTPWV